MIKKNVRRCLLVCALGAVASVLGVFMFVCAQEDNASVVIYHTNDIHGNVNTVVNDGITTQIGLDLIKSVKDSTPGCLLIDAGDALQGTELGKYRKGKDIIEIMNAVGYDGMVPGNHEFDFGSDAIEECARSAKFPVISANTCKNGSPLLKDINGGNGCRFIKEAGGKKIGFFGITTEETNRTTIPPNLEGITFKKEAETAAAQVKLLRAENVDLVIGIMHVGIDVSSKITSHDIAAKVPGIDVIIDGHSHTRTTDTVGNTVISQTGAGSISLGKIEIKFSDDKPDIHASTISAQDIGHMFTPNEEITKLYEDRYAKIKPNQEKVIGKIENNLYGGTYCGKNICRFAETNMGDLIGDAMIHNSKSLLKDTEMKNMPVVAFENGGAVRSKIDAGYITMANVNDVLPLDNKICAQIITPKQLFKVLERGVGKLTAPKVRGEPFSGPFGGFPQIAGMVIEADPSLKPYDYEKNSGGNRITSVRLLNDDGSLGRTLSADDDKTRIVFLCNDYTIYEFPAIKDQKIEIPGKYLSDVLAEYIQKLTFEGNGKFSYPLSVHRVNIKKDEGVFSDFESEITVKNDSGIIANANVSVNIDGDSYGTFTTDDNGKFKIKSLKTGNHDVSVEYNGISSNLYINDEMGLNSNTVLITDNSENYIANVSNIIGQIPYIITEDSVEIIKFARSSFNDLNGQSKDKVMNYGKLEKAEEKLANLGKIDSIPDASYFDQHKTTVITVLFFAVLSGSAIIWLVYKNKKPPGVKIGTGSSENDPRKI